MSTFVSKSRLAVKSAVFCALALALVSGLASAQSSGNLLTDTFRFTEPASAPRLMASPEEIQRAVNSLVSGDSIHRARLDASITKALADIDMLQARYRSPNPSFGFDARSILTEAAILLRIARGVQAASGSPSNATLNLLRDELVQVEMDLVDALQRVGNTSVNIHVGQGSNIQPLAVIYDALYDDFTPAQRQSIASAIVNYGIIPSFNGLLAPINHSDRKWWAKGTSINNWTTIVIGGGVMGSLALRQSDYDGSFSCWPGTSNATSKVTRTFREHFDIYLPAAVSIFSTAWLSVQDMGGLWDEGPGYSHDFAYPLLATASSLETARRNPVSTPPVFMSDFATLSRQSATSMIQMGIHFSGPSRREFTHNDGNWSFTDQAACYLLADRARQVDPSSDWRAAAWRARDRSPATWSGLHFLWHSLFDWNSSLTTDRGMSGFDPASIELSHYFHNVRIESSPVARSGSNEHIAVWRQSWTDTDSTAVFLKGGDKRGDRHEHLDTGDFLFDSLGVRWNADHGPPVGYPSYIPPAPHSGSTSYQTYPKRAMGQNTLVVNPGRNDYLSRAVPKSWLDAVLPDQAMDDGLSSHWAPLENLNTTPTASIWSATVNLSSAYARHGIRTAAQGAPSDPRRTFTWDRATGALEVRDTLSFSQPDNEVFWYWQLPGTAHKPVHLSENRVVLQAMKGATPVYLDLELISANGSSNGGFRYSRIDENLPSARPSDSLLWGYDNSAWQRNNLRKLTLRFTTAGDSLDFTVRATPLSQLTGLSENAALIQLGLLQEQSSVSCGWPFNGTLDNAHGGTPLVAGAGSPVFASGGPEGSGFVDFDGVDDELRTAIPLDFGERITLAAWINIPPGASNIQTIMANTASGAANGFKFYVNNYNTTDGALVLETANGVNQSKAFTAAGAVPTGTWTHVAAVVDRAAGHTRLFVNGTLVTTQSATRTDFTPDGTLRLGRMSPGGGAFPFTGSMDDARYLPRAMTAAEIRTLCAQSHAHRWTFQSDTRDVAGSAPAATLIHGAALTATNPRGGLQSLSVDGNDDAVNLGALSLGDSFTFSGWLRITEGRSSMQTILFCRPTGSSTGTGIHLYANTWNTSDRKLHLNTGNGTVSAAIASATGAVPFGEWVHVAAVIQRVAGNARLYVNGTEVASGSIRTDLPNDMPLFLGSMGGGQYTQNLQGNFEEVRLDKRALTTAEIAGLAQLPGMAPVISGVSIQPNPPQAGQPVSLTLSASDPDSQDLLRHSFVWGDASPSTAWSTQTTSPAKTYSTNVLQAATARVDDGTFLVEMNVQIDLTPPNTPPTISAPALLQGGAGQATGTLTVSIGDAETPAANLMVSAASGNPTLLPNSALILGGTGESRTLTVEVPAWAAGTVPVTLTVSDGMLATSTVLSLQIANSGWGTNWSATHAEEPQPWSLAERWADGHAPVSGPDVILRFFDGLPLPGTGIHAQQDLANPFVLSEWILGGNGPSTEGGSMTLAGYGVRLVSPSVGGPARVRLDATSGAGFSYIIGVPVELAAATEFSGNGDASFVFSGQLSGSGAVSKAGSSIMTLGGAAPHLASGPWSISAGGLAFEPGLDHRLPASTSISFTGSSFWDLGGNHQSVTGLDLANTTHQLALTATVRNGSLHFNPPGSVTLGPTTSNTGPVSNNSCLLDLSALDAFTIQSGSDLWIQPKTYNTQSASSVLRLGTSSILAMNRLNIGGIAGGGSHSATLELGRENQIHADEINIGRSARATGILRYRDGLATPGTTTLRAANGTSRIARIQLGEQWGGGGDNLATADFTGGSVDVFADLVEIGRATANSRPCTATFTIGSDGGLIDANQIVLGMADGTAAGQISAAFQQRGGTVRSSSLVLGSTTGSHVPSIGAIYQLDPGATLETSSITAGLAGRASVLSDRRLRFNGGLLTNKPGASALRIAGRPDSGSLAMEFITSGTLHIPDNHTAVIEPTVRLVGTGKMVKTGAGRLVSNATGSEFSGKTEILEGSLDLVSDGALGAIPGQATPDAVVINGAALTLNQGWQGTLTMIAPGSGHTSFPLLDLSGVSGETIRTHGGIASLTILQQGASNHTAAAISFTAPDLPGGVQATATATVSGGKLTSVTLTHPGSGYTVPPKIFITLSGGTSTTVQPVLGLNLSIHGAVVIDPGHDCDGSTPLVTVIGGGGPGTAFAATAGLTPSIVLDERRGITIGPSGAALGCIGNHRIAGPVSGSGTLTKVLPGVLTIGGGGTHSGDIRVLAGELRLASASIANTAAVSVASGTTLRLEFSGADEVRSLNLNGSMMPPGIYHSNNTGGLITGTGSLVVPGPTYASWIQIAFPGASDPAITGFRADPDHDGIPSGIEFILGGNPATPGDSALLPTLGTSDSILRFTFRRSAAARNMQVRVEAAQDPGGPWQTLVHGTEGAVFAEETDGFGPGIDRVTVSLPVANSARAFLRLAATVP